MKVNLPVKLAAIASLALSSLPLTFPVKASEFTETMIDQTQVIAIARPYGEQKYDLLVIEQIPKKKQCWAESGMNPVLVNPLLLNFDFTGHCRRATDSNGYSVRIDGNDYGLEYLMRIVPRGNELVLVATSRTGKAPELIIGSTQGLASGFMRIILKPGWQFTKRTFNNKPLGHFYFSARQADIMNTGTTQPQPTITQPPIPNPVVTPTPTPTPTIPTVPTPVPTPTISPKPSVIKPTPVPTPKPSVTPTKPNKIPSVNDFRKPK